MRPTASQNSVLLVMRTTLALVLGMMTPWDAGAGLTRAPRHTAAAQNKLGHVNPTGKKVYDLPNDLQGQGQKPPQRLGRSEETINPKRLLRPNTRQMPVESDKQRKAEGGHSPSARPRTAETVGSANKDSRRKQVTFGEVTSFQPSEFPNEGKRVENFPIVVRRAQKVEDALKRENFSAPASTANRVPDYLGGVKPVQFSPPKKKVSFSNQDPSVRKYHPDIPETLGGGRPVPFTPGSSRQQLNRAPLSPAEAWKQAYPYFNYPR